MLSFTEQQVREILLKIENENTDSNLGFFSKPYLVDYENQPFIVKTYLPIKSHKLTSSIIENHHQYVTELSATGIRVPQTFITQLKQKHKYQIVIVQYAFKKEELFRDIVATSSIEDVKIHCQQILEQTMIFWENKAENIGFHPTLRNYALHNNELHYFDTFPPMSMDQIALNKIIIKLSPFGKLIKGLVPQKAINRVSNEYYQIDKMITGIVGSCCRLRPDAIEGILEVSKAFVSNSSLDTSTKKRIIEEIETPPNLSTIWTTVRKLSGNIGQPNVKKSNE